MSNKNASYPEQSDPTPDPHTPVVYEEENVTVEYKHIERDLEKGPFSEKELNKYGKENWELVAAFSHQSVLHYYFKRLKPE